MAIRTKQIATIANTVIAQFLQQGQFPSVHAVVAAVYAQLTGVPGTPVTSFTPFSYGTATNAGELTVLAADIAADIQTLYDESIDQVNRIVRDFDYKDTRRGRLAQRLVALEAELDAALAGTQVHRGTIASFAGIDPVATSAFLNFHTHTAELPPASNRTTKVDLSAATLRSSAPVGSAVTGSLNNITNDLLNAVYFVRLGTVANSAQLQISATLPTASTFSKIVVVGHVSAATQITLQLDAETLTTQTLDIGKQVEWTFAPRVVTTITLTLAKSAPDVSQGGTNYFDFGLKSLSAYQEDYVPSAVFQTQSLSFGAPLGTLTLTADQDVPPNCSIAWAASFDGGAFTPLVPGTPLTVATLAPADAKRVFPVLSVRSNATVTTIEADQTGALVETIPVLAPIRGGRTPLFTLCSVNAGVTTGNTQVRRGRNAWHVRSYHYSIEQNGVVQDPAPSLNDFVVPRGTTPEIFARYQPTEFDVANQYNALSADEATALRLPALEQPTQDQFDRVMHLFEATLTVDPGLAPATLAGLRATAISLPFVFGNSKAALYLNGTQIPLLSSTSGGGVQYSCVLPLQTGANLLQIVTNNYAALGGASFDVGTSVFTALCAYGGEIAWYADPGPMTEVSLFELQYQTARNDFSRYARAQGTNGNDQLLLVRELPTCVYDVTTALVPADGPSTVTLQATLAGSPVSSSLTPKISSYTLAMSYQGGS